MADLGHRQGASELGRATSTVVALPRLVSTFSLCRMRKVLGSLHLKVHEWQRRSRLERLNRNVASDFADNWQIEEFADQKALVRSEIRHDHFEEVVRLTGDEVARNDLRHLYDRFLKRQCALIGVPVDLDA
jgi:hypothetical protein